MTGKPWFGEYTADFAKAFPNIESIDFTIDANPWGFYNLRHNPIHLTRASARSSIACPNPSCRRGGFDFGQFLQNHSWGSAVSEIDQTYFCNGDEGSPAGRKKGRSCDNAFKVKGTITYKQSQ